MAKSFIKYKELESRIFGLKIGQLVANDDTIGYINSISMDIDDNDPGYDIVDIRVPYHLTRYVKDIQTRSSIYVGSIVTFELDIGMMTIQNSDISKNCRLATYKDLNKCIRIGKESFVDSNDGINRFNLDHHFDKHQIEKYYGEWCRNCFSGYNADSTIVYEKEDENRIKGFMSIKKIGDLEYNIPLNAVERVSRRKGVYIDMLNWTINGLHNNEEDKILVNIRTYLGNIAIQKVWIGIGAKIKGIEHVFHYWMK